MASDLVQDILSRYKDSRPVVRVNVTLDDVMALLLVFQKEHALHGVLGLQRDSQHASRPALFFDDDDEKILTELLGTDELSDMLDCILSDVLGHHVSIEAYVNGYTTYDLIFELSPDHPVILNLMEAMNK